MRGRVDILPAIVGLMLCLAGCSSGYAGQTSILYNAMVAGDREAALVESERLVDLSLQEDSDDLLTSSYPLLLLERASAYQSLGYHEQAVGDFYEADQMLEVLDLTPSGTENLTRYLFSDDSTLYRAPMYEKLMVNVSSIISYLAMGDFGGAMVEARRINVLLSYYASGELADHPMLGAGHYIAGLAMEYGGEPMEALRHYISAYLLGSAPGLAEAIVRLADGTFMAGRQEVSDARAELGLGPDDPPPAGAAQEILVIVMSGMPPRREAERFPLGIVFGWIRGPYNYSLMGFDQSQADRILAERAMTWVNFPVLVATPPRFTQFRAETDGQRRMAEPVADVASFAMAQWEVDRPAVAASAVTRAIVRILAREATQAIAGDETAGFIAGLAVQGIMQAMDTPDTRSWRSMPATLSIARLPVSVGDHDVAVVASGPGGSDVRAFRVSLGEGQRAVLAPRFY